MPTSDPTLDTLLAFALDAAWQAGRVTLAHFQTGIAPERKADNSPVTLADKQSEQKLRELIGNYWPDHGIIGEEFGQSQGESRYTWILDPIDGTKSFVSGVPLYAVLVALVEDENPVLGVVHFPGLNETIYARRDGGCYWNGRSAHVSDVSTMADAVLVASDIDSFAQYGRQAAWQRLIDSTYIQRTWGDAYGYALVATGRAEIMVDPIMALWDCGPMQIILEEAGGVFTDWDGKPSIYGGNSVATNQALHAQVMALIHGDSD